MAVTQVLSKRAAGRGLQEQSTVDSSGGAGDAGKIPSLDANGQIDPSFIPSSGTISAPASEALSAGDFVNGFDNGGTFEWRLADSTNGREADGYVLAAAAVAATATVYTRDSNTALTGLTIGADYYLDAAGGVTTTPTTTSGEIRQYLGVATSATSLLVEIDNPIEIA